MLLGPCAGWDEQSVRKIRARGCDCVETALFLIEKGSEDALKRSREVMDEIGLKCLTSNGMLTGNMPLLGGKECYGPLEEYLKSALPKAKILGVKVIVLGCGFQRTVPAGMDIGVAEERFCGVLKDLILPMADSFGMTVALEELRKEECNFINSAKEAADIVRRVGRNNFKLHIDYFHTVLGGGTLEEIAGYGDMIAHVHVSSLKHFREYPKLDDVEEFIAFRQALEKAGYNGTVTFEGVMPGDFWQTLDEAMQTMRKAGF